MENSRILSILNANYPQNFTSIELLRDSGCLAYTAFANETRYFLRLVKPAFFDSAKSALDVQLFLLSQDFPVPAVIRTREGAPYIPVPDVEGEYLLTLCAYLDGTEADPEADAEALGALTSRLHQIMLAYPGQLVRRDKAYYIGRYLGQLRRRKYARADEFSAYGEALWQRLSALARGACHGDLYSGNVLKTADGKLYILDFDTFCEGIPLYDIALICNQTDYMRLSSDAYEKTREVFARFLPQYRLYHPLSEPEAAALYDAIALSHFTIQATILEIFGLSCVDDAFLDCQLDWLYAWRTMCQAHA